MKKKNKKKRSKPKQNQTQPIKRFTIIVFDDFICFNDLADPRTF